MNCNHNYRQGVKCFFFVRIFILEISCILSALLTCVDCIDRYVDLLLGEFKHYKTRLAHGGIRKEVLLLLIIMRHTYQVHANQLIPWIYTLIFEILTFILLKRIKHRKQFLVFKHDFCLANSASVCVGSRPIIGLWAWNCGWNSCWRTFTGEEM